MTPERLREILDALGWNATALARRLGMARERSATEWLNGRRPIPQPVADWLELMLPPRADRPAAVLISGADGGYRPSLHRRYACGPRQASDTEQCIGSPRYPV